MSLSPIETLGRLGITPPQQIKGEPTAEGVNFADSLGKALEAVEEKGLEANVAVTGMLNGTVDVHDGMIALHEAEEAIELTVAIRNKVVNAYQEIMRMPL